MRRKKITVVTYNQNCGLIYQRAHLPFRHLKDIYDFDFVDITDVHHTDLFYSDALVIFHAHTADFLYLIQKAKYQYKIPVIVDLDDLLMNMPSDHPEFSKISGQTATNIIQFSDQAVYSTPFLKTKLGHLCKKSTVIENTLPADVFANYTQPKRAHKVSFTVGWTGGNSHMSDILQTFMPGLREFMRKHDDVRSYFHGLCPSELYREFGAQIFFDSEYVDFLDYHAKCEKYPFDVCLVGLTSTEFNDAKSDLRLLDMAPHNIPIIASPRSDFLKHKDRKICLYADDSDSNYMTWLEALEYVKANPEEIKEMTSRASQYVKQERLSTVAAEKWFNVLESAFTQRGCQQMGRSLLASSLELQRLD